MERKSDRDRVTGHSHQAATGGVAVADDSDEGIRDGLLSGEQPEGGICEPRPRDDPLEKLAERALCLLASRSRGSVSAQGLWQIGPAVDEAAREFVRGPERGVDSFTRERIDV